MDVLVRAWRWLVNPARSARPGSPLRTQLAWRLATAAVVGALVLWAAGAVGSPRSAPTSGGGAVTAPSSPAEPTDTAAYQAALEAELGAVLSGIQGAGRVVVRVTLASGATTRYAQNDQASTQTTNQTGGNGSSTTTQTSTQQQVVTVSQGGGQQPVVAQVTPPEVQGVVVVASGAGDPGVAATIAQAVEVLLGVPAYRVLVLAGGGGG